MPPSILKALFVIIFMFGFAIITQPKALMRMPSHIFGKVTKKDTNDVNLF
jgi:hypothetical protein